MITVDKATLLIIYLGIFLFFCLGAWLAYHVKGRKKESLPPLYHLITCEYCHFHYLAQAEKHITRCPQCHSFNNSSAEKYKR